MPEKECRDLVMAYENLIEINATNNFDSGLAEEISYLRNYITALVIKAHSANNAN